MSYCRSERVGAMVEEDLWDRPEMAEALDNRDLDAILRIYLEWTGRPRVSPPPTVVVTPQD